MKNLTVLVNSCDDYYDVWPFFFSALDEYWSDRKLDVVLNIEMKKPNFASNIIISNFTKTGNNNSWGVRLIESLKVIKTDYVLAVYDDFILEDFVDEFEINEIISKMKSDPDIAVVYLTKLGLKVRENNCLMSERKSGNKYSLLDDKIDYRLNSAPAIWRRIDLLNYTGIFDSPWAWELFGTYRTIGSGRKFYCPAEEEKNIFSYNSKKGGAIYRGRWVRDVVVEKDKKYNLNTDFTKRGFSSADSNEKRTLKWKLKFILLGYKMIGFKVLMVLFRALKSKYS
jgi:hypothetical protein